MSHDLDTAVLPLECIEYNALPLHLPSCSIALEERLPFTVKLVQNQADWCKVLQLRHATYARYGMAVDPRFEQGGVPDTDQGSVILLAESKLDGSPIGTMRIQTNWFSPLNMEQSATLPEWLHSRPLAEASHLGVTENRIGRTVKTVLFKAYYQYCLQNGIEWMLIAGSSITGREYDRLLLSAVYPGTGYFALPASGMRQTRILSFEVGSAQERWTKARHPLTDFMFHTLHPDIEIETHLPVQFQ